MSDIPTEAMCDAARWFILARDANIFTWGGLSKCIDPETVIPHIRDKIKNSPTGHITKWDFAECIYMLMRSVGQPTVYTVYDVTPPDNEVGENTRGEV